MIVQICRENVASLGGTPEVEFIHDANEIMNTMTDGLTVFPAALLDEPIEFKVVINQSGYLGVIYDIEISFVSQTEFIDNETVIEAICKQMLWLGMDFITNLLNDSRVIAIHEADGWRFSNMFDANLSGVTLKLKVEIKNERDICVE